MHLKALMRGASREIAAPLPPSGARHPVRMRAALTSEAVQ
jgi:hypothetical protein